MRPVDKAARNGENYSPYGSAKDDLFTAIGGYCSYCERQGHSSAIDVEHIKNKDDYPELTEEWENFLLACKNCNSIKGKKDFQFDEIILPHLNNTFTPFDYKSGGLIQVKASLENSERSKAQALVDLIGLLRRPGSDRYSVKDKRWQERLETWNKAERYLQKFSEGHADLEAVCDLAKSCGFWSVWMTVFKDHLDVKQALIEKFSGTNSSYFS